MGGAKGSKRQVEGRSAILRDIKKLEEWTGKTLIKFNKYR